MNKKEYKKNCNQVTIPNVDNSNQECYDFLFSKCIIVDRKSTFINNSGQDNLDEYFEMLDDKFNKLKNQIAYLTQIVKILQEGQTGEPDGIGTFED